MEKKYVVGVDLGGTKIYTALVDLEGNIIKEKTVETLANEGEQAVMGRIIDTINYVIDGTDKDSIRSIGIGSPGPLDVKNGIIIQNSNLPFKNFAIVKTIKETYDLPTYLDNDANVAGLAEALLGAGKGKPTCYYVTISTGIGGAFVVNGQLVSGGRGYAGEVGNIIVKNNGYKFGGLNPGAVEGEASGTAITRKGKEILGEDRVNHAGDVFRLADEGDIKAKGIVDECVSELATMLADIAHTVDPHCFVLGGGVMKSKKYFYDQLVEQFNAKIHVGMRGHIPILERELEDCGAIGAAMLPMSKLK